MLGDLNVYGEYYTSVSDGYMSPASSLRLDGVRLAADLREDRHERHECSTHAYHEYIRMALSAATHMMGTLHADLCIYSFCTIFATHTR